LRRDYVIVLCTIALAVGYLYETLQIPSLDTVDPLGPRAYPYLIFAGLIVSAIWLSLETLQKKKAASRSNVPAQETDAEPEGRHGRMLAAVVVWLGLYYAAIVPLGFVVSSFVFLVGLTACFNPGKWVANVLTSFIFVVGFYFLFTSVLGVPLTKGVLDF